MTRRIEPLSSSVSPPPPSYCNTNGMPQLLDGSTLHLTASPGQVANRIISVGAAARAKTIATHLDTEPTMIVSDRGFTIYTGAFQGVAVSIIATGMGLANMDFVVREARAVVSPPLAIVRYGTCGGLQAHLPPGAICVATPGSVLIQRSPDGFEHLNPFTTSPSPLEAEDMTDVPKTSPYSISKIVRPHPGLSQQIVQELTHELDITLHPVVETLNATACSFYSSQGRQDANFHDANESVLTTLLMQQPEIGTMEMESFHLLDLARCSRGDILASAAVILVANRITGEVVDNACIEKLERAGGLAILRALIAQVL